MAEIISLAARRAARRSQEGPQPGDRAASDAAPCSVLLFTGIRYEAGDAPPALVGRPWFGRLEPRDVVEPGTS